MARLTSLDDLRRIIPEPRPASRSKILEALDEQSIDFLKRCPFALVGTVSADGAIEVSPKGDEPGFIRVEDPRTLVMPERVGNNLAFGLTNMIANGRIGMICLVPATTWRLRSMPASRAPTRRGSGRTADPGLAEPPMGNAADMG